MVKIDLKNYDIIEMESFITSLGEPKFRAKQIFKWIQKGAEEFSEMTDISKSLIEKFESAAYISKSKILITQISKKDETRKYLLEMSDGNTVETVLMKYNHGYSICVSSQIGCRMGCNFCASTINGLVRNLTAGEILDQVMTVSKDIGERISNIVIMGMGEPFDNYDNVIKFMRLVNNKEGLNIGYRHITISTSGLVPGIVKFAKENIPSTLAISLHAPNDELRKKIMPIARRYKINEILEACNYFIECTGRRITFEYSLMEGVNDSERDAIELAKLLKHMLCHVNIIPINKVEERDYKRSSDNAVIKFHKRLESLGINSTVRRELGSDISAACGQLRNSQAKQ